MFLGAAAAVALALALPATTPRGDVLDLVTQRVGSATVVGQEPSPAASTVQAPALDAAAPSPDPVTATVAQAAIPRRPPVADPVAGQAPGAAPAGAPAVGTLQGYRWPIAHPRITAKFGPEVSGSFVVDGNEFHDGVDIATFCGDRITAAHDGTVLAAGRHFDKLMGWVGGLDRYFGRLDRQHLWSELPIVVVIDDGNGYRSLYAHFGRLTVKSGQSVHAGQLLGFEGATGHATGCHLHYGLFSPAETDTFRLRGDIAKRMQLPRHEIARINPLRVLPARPPAHAAEG